MAAYTGRPGVDWGAVAQAVNVDAHLQAQDEARKADAIRWQGQQDYQTLIDSGVDPAEALRRSSAKLFFNDPRGQAAVVHATQPMRATKQGSVENINGIDFIRQPNGQLVEVRQPKNAIVPTLPLALQAQLEERAIKNKLLNDRLAATSKEGAVTANPDIYSAATNAAAIWDARAKRFAPPSIPGAPVQSVAPPSISEFAGWETPASENPLPSESAADIPATAENAAMLTRRSFPAWGNMPPPAPMLAPMGAGAPVNTGPVQVRTQSEYDALPKGAQYLRSDGKVYTKK